MNTIGYLNQVKRRLGIESDYALAQQLGVTRQAVGSMTKGKTTMGDATAIKVAEVLGLPKALVLADAHAEREKNPEIQAVWRSMVEKFSMGFEALIRRSNPRLA